MKYPPYLKNGDRVAIVSPAGKISRPVVERAISLIREQGFEVETGEHLFNEEGVFAGGDSDRAYDMQNAIDNKNIRAIFCSRGGYGSLRTHNLLNWSAFFKKPKWIIGFSDITVFHAYLVKHCIPSIHGVMPAFFEHDGAVTGSFLMTMDLLRGQIPKYSFIPHPLNRPGQAEGVLTGGNLSVLFSLRGTPLDISPHGKILFIEDVSEYRYHLDRMMTNLKTGGILKQISGLIVGNFTEMKDGDTCYAKDSYEIIREAVDCYRYPVMFGFPAGHQLPNLPLILGSRVTLNVSADKSDTNTIRYPITNAQ